MVCDICHEREAVIYCAQEDGGKKIKFNLCMECAQQKGIMLDPGNIESSVKKIESSVIKRLFDEYMRGVKKIQAESSRACPVCGTSIAEIRKTLRVGCPECYAIFKSDIRKCLDGRNIKGSYTGTMPHRLSTIRSVLNDRIILQNKLNDAVAREDYEKAALYRDYLKALEKNPVSSSESQE